MPKKLMQTIPCEVIYGTPLTSEHVHIMLEGERHKIIARVEEVRQNYGAISPEIIASIEAERLVKSYKLN